MLTVTRRHWVATLIAASCLLAAMLVPLAGVAEASHGGEDVDCPDGGGDNPVSKEEAQRILDQDRSDPHDLDRDQDGEACDISDESTARESQYPSGGAPTGGGATADRATTPLPLALSGAAFIILAATAGAMVLRQRPDR